MGALDLPTLSSDRLVLEPLTRAHADGMFALWREPLVCEFAGPCVDSAGRVIALPVASRRESDRILDYWLDRAREGTGFRFAALVRDGRAFVGAVGFNRLGATAEYAYHFVPIEWGRGLAREASQTALEWVFSRGTETVEAWIEPPNTRSIRLVEALGFVRRRAAPGPTDRYVLQHAAIDVG